SPPLSPSPLLYSPFPGLSRKPGPQPPISAPDHSPLAPMPRRDVHTPRLYVEAPIEEGASIALDASQANYLGNVLRLKTGDCVLVFNGRDGEWQGRLASTAKRRLALAIGRCAPPPNRPP